MIQRVPLVFLLTAMLATPAIVGSTPALAYGEGCQTSATGNANPTVVDGGGTVDFTVTFTNCNGGGVQGVQVVFAASGPCAAGFNPPSGVSDASGTVRTKVTLPPNCPCQYTLTATGGGTSATTNVRESGCLPFTAAASTIGANPGPAAGITMIVLGILFAGLGTWRLRRTRA
jgi:hypothetical protein